MARVGEEEVEYESDPEDAKLSLTMRRREASDDEDEEVEERVAMPLRRIDSRVSDTESDGQGAAAVYDDDEEEDIEEEEDEELEEDHEYEERQTGVDVKVALELDGDSGRSVGQLSGVSQVEEEKKENHEFTTDNGGNGVYVPDDQYGDNADPKVEEEKKENEPFAVPTAGAFYMHDDRFRDSAGGRNRRTLGGRRLWESKDDRKWGHDKFEEMTMHERHYEEGRRASRGRSRARGKNRGEDHGKDSEDRGYLRGNRPKAYSSNNQNNPPKGVRGRGPRRYQPAWKNYNEVPAKNKQPGKSVEKNSYVSPGRVSAPTSNVESDPAPAKNQAFASSLSSASPPFYPSASSNKEISLTQKRDAQAVPTHRNTSSGKDESFSMSQSMQRKNEAEFIGMNKLYIDDSVLPHNGKPSTNLPSQSSGQSPQPRVQGRGQSPLVAYQSTAPHNQTNRVYPPTQLHNVQRAPVQTRSQPSLQASGQQLGQRTGRGTQASSSSEAALIIHSNESREMESHSESTKSNTSLVGKGKGGLQGNGRGGFPFVAAQVMGVSSNMGGSGHGDQNFPATPTFLPVMQFGGQHPGGMGVPAVGMAFPGYVAQPQLGLGNSEMTWLPVLAGAAGALGATYCSPYLSVDGAYHAHPSGQTPSLAAASSKESNTSKSGNELKPSQRPELAIDEYGQRQNKARRYTEMKFDQ